MPRQAHRRTGRGEGAMGGGGGGGGCRGQGSLGEGLVGGTFFREWYCRRNSFEVLSLHQHYIYRSKKQLYIYSPSGLMWPKTGCPKPSSLSLPLCLSLSLSVSLSRCLSLSRSLPLSFFGTDSFGYPVFCHSKKGAEAVY